jgi:hypothetical protein
MGEAKKRGTQETRAAEARERRANEILEARAEIAEMGFPSDSQFTGYVVFVPDTDDYLMEVVDKGDQIHRTYCRSPEPAIRFFERERAEQAAKSLPKKATVGLLFDVGTQLVAILEK